MTQNRLCPGGYDCFAELTNSGTLARMGPRAAAAQIDLDAALAPALRLAIVRLARVLRQQDADSDVTMSQLSALGVVAGRGPLTLGELASVERVRPPTMTRIAAALEESGHVRREPDPTDRRVARLHVTEVGRNLLAESRARRTAYLERHLAALSAKERTALRTIIPLLDRLAGVPS